MLQDLQVSARFCLSSQVSGNLYVCCSVSTGMNLTGSCFHWLYWHNVPKLSQIESKREWSQPTAHSPERRQRICGLNFKSSQSLKTKHWNWDCNFNLLMVSWLQSIIFMVFSNNSIQGQVSVSASSTSAAWMSPTQAGQWNHWTVLIIQCSEAWAALWLTQTASKLAMVYRDLAGPILIRRNSQQPTPPIGSNTGTAKHN